MYYPKIIHAPAMLLMALIMMISTCGDECSTTILVERNTDSEIEAEMLRIAEGHYPPREDIELVYEGSSFPQDERVWWYTEGGLRLPYAITAEAVEYYHEYSLADECECVWGCFGNMCSHLDFSYQANVSFHEHYVVESFEDRKDDSIFTSVFVVSMRLSWFYSSNPLAGFGFYKERLVIISEIGEVLEVYGDGITEEIVAKAQSIWPQLTQNK